jgi:hypothetical protein
MQDHTLEIWHHAQSRGGGGGVWHHTREVGTMRRGKLGPCAGESWDHARGKVGTMHGGKLGPCTGESWDHARGKVGTMHGETKGINRDK